ncbi:glycine cleavage system protein GcvH [Meiothermus ruber]|jgi:glycine cleavage system H protein|uniref:Glycine cleavage system H protein n=1 Tax=Meiothermus ruber (strain ATCC 35948 / DSM 1279 / VKM B-1258 / 21) TaxID=504728 RepID=D3PSN9_MEIRD|nr:glycine cleavage system protein GcvH [Meiothermus ruber]ADD28472.1 glycine cleavage system H protein [Meiothermus ruber DSM 1279]AGK06087.1 glycine cleavage system protein H [Meiothermus ruber DSM 1279]MCL6530111.1 glycine cleavage system protein GcvH [Meiothermus ruber]MCX7801913.1 glycine cleavage system protein GcvH [Meiothermus ruber]
MNYPSELKYTKSHEWVRLEGDVAVVGITDFAQDALGDVVFVDLPQVGKAVEAGSAVAVVESVKTASDIYAPVAGEILEVNSALSDKPELINQSPYGEGWLFKMRVNPADLNGLLSAVEYQAVAESQ